MIMTVVLIHGGRSCRHNLFPQKTQMQISCVQDYSFRIDRIFGISHKALFSVEHGYRKGMHVFLLTNAPPFSFNRQRKIPTLT